LETGAGQEEVEQEAKTMDGTCQELQVASPSSIHPFSSRGEYICRVIKKGRREVRNDIEVITCEGLGREPDWVSVKI